METETPQPVTTPPRIPPAIDGIQVNFCKNPACCNFGVPASDAAKWSRGDRYKRSGEKDKRSLVCQDCGETIPIKSNQGIAEELQRMAAFLAPLESVSCKNDKCPNHTITIAQDSSLYIVNGSTDAGSQRFRCKTCHKTFSIPLAANLRQRKKGKSTEVFRLLTCQVAIRKMAKNARVGIGAVHRYIHLIHRQCLLFAANRERFLSERKFRRLYIAVDRQQHEVNWISQKDRRTTPLQAVVSADQKTGYIFALHVNFDPDQDHAEVDEASRASGDNLLDPPFRQFARLWVNEDYERSNTGKARRKPGKQPIAEQIESTYEEVSDREDVEASDTAEPGTRLPSKGMQVHAEYTLYGHFFYLSKLLAGAEKIRFYCDQESGIRAAIMAAFCERIMAKECDAFYVKINKELTNPQKLNLVAKSQRELEEFRASSKAYEHVKDHDLRVFKATAEMVALREIGKWKDRWFIFPFPNMSEPEKGVCYLTNTKEGKAFDYDDTHLARLHLKGSLHSVDRFFNLVRSNLSLLQRPVASASSGRRMWYRTNPYDPHHVAVTLEIFRVWYNYIETGSDGKTPAMRLGLAEKAYTEDEILRYWPSLSARTKGGRSNSSTTAETPVLQRSAQECSGYSFEGENI